MKWYFIVCLFALSSTYASTSVSDSAENCEYSSTPANGHSKCRRSNNTEIEGWICVGECDEGFLFPTGYSKDTIYCGKETGTWLPLSTFEDCLSEEDVVDHLFNTRCAAIKDPKNGYFYCFREENFQYQCYIECNEGFEFPGGQTMVSHVCDIRTDLWEEEQVPYSPSPDCGPICDPPCENGGKCVLGEPNYCDCNRTGSRREHCRFSCYPEKAFKQVNGIWICYSTLTENICRLKCPEGQRFEYRPANEYHCDLDSGEWTIDWVPKCVLRRRKSRRPTKRKPSKSGLKTN